MNHANQTLKWVLPTLCLLASASLVAAPERASQPTTKAKPATVTATSPATVTAKPAQATPGNITAKPGTVLTLCCGSVDPHEMTGSNCAYMHTGQGCAGSILACPKGSKDTVTKDGSGYCKSGDSGG